MLLPIFLALLPSILASPLVLQRVPAVCTAEFRLAQLDGVAPAFSDQTLGGTARFLQQLPLKPDATLTLFVNGAPGITVAPDASTVRNFALIVRQVFFRVTPTMNPTSIDFGNGTTFTNLEIETGVLKTIQLPVNINAGMNFNYDLADCRIESLEGFLTVPSAVLGRPVRLADLLEAILGSLPGGSGGLLG